ncbi:MAG TPA: CheR family methyltransferase [Ramlibacter sp.]|nr:CheR family methyltransferase [Ramlibacter sp.]
MTQLRPDQAEESSAANLDEIVPGRGFDRNPVVGLGGSAGSIPALKSFFDKQESDSGLAFVVVMHLSPEHESTLPQLLQRSTKMKVEQVRGPLAIEPNHVYVIPPRYVLRVEEGRLELQEQAAERGRNVAVDLFFRTLADTHGPRAAAVVLSGADSDGAIGIKRIKERGGLTIAQDPDEAELGSMPRASIATGMVDWVLPVADIPHRLLDYFKLESKLKLPPEDGPQLVQAARPQLATEEAALREVLTFLRTRTGRDFSFYKRATILRRVGRRMQVNGVADLHEYLQCLRTRPGESGALLHDLLISVTNFFRDSECFDAFEKEIPAILAGKGPNDAVRVWVPACATGEEAYSIAMLLSEHARAMAAPPLIQIFASDLDEEAVQAAREGVYPPAIQADVNEDRLRRFFVNEHRGYRVRRELREMILFAAHDVLKDSPFSRLDIVSCRNLLIYLNRDAQKRVFDTFHFALVPGGRLFLGTSESVEDGSTLFNVIDKKHRVFQQRPTPRGALPLPSGPGTLALAMEAQASSRDGPVTAGAAFRNAGALPNAAPPEARTTSWSELHLRMLEMLAPPSILVDAEYDIVHLSPGAGRFLQFSGGEPTRNLLRSVNPSLRIELRAALFQAAQSQTVAEVSEVPVEVGGQPVLLTIRALPAKDMGADMFLVVLHAVTPEQDTGAKPPLAGDNVVALHLDHELERLKTHLRDTVEQYEASNEELKASNEELQAMNEELRSATEELETSREELQSINEELTTVNHELKNKVDELAHANSDMHNLMDATEIATVFLDRDLRITRFTPTAVQLFNLIGTDVGRPLTDLKTRLQYPDLGVDALRVLDKLVPIEREVGQADGSWYLARLLPYRTIEDRIAGVVLSFINITERKQAEEMRLWLSAVVTATSDAIISFALDGTILSWNQGAERIYGYSMEEAIGSHLSILAPEGSADQAALIAKIASAQVIEDYETMRLRRDGSELHVSITVSPIRDESGKVMAGTAMVRDITAAKLADKALRAALEENEIARAQLEAADSAKDRFLAVLSHELRNPLASIDGAAGVMLAPGIGDGDASRAAEIVQRQSRSMKTLLDDLLDVSRLKLGRLELRREPTRVSSVVTAALETTQPLLAQSGHGLTVDMPKEDVELDADPVRLAQVVSNLLVNAIRYTPRGGKIELQVRLDGGQLHLGVKDNGVGMNPERIADMFDMYTQGDPTGDRALGLGIGLALVKNIVELHGGKVTAHSKGAGKGSEFHIALPGARSAGKPAAAPSRPASAAPNKKRGTVLVADDNADWGWGVAKLLDMAGFETLLVQTGREALDAIEQQKPDAVVLDIGLPDIDGRDVARRVRAADWGKQTVLVAATGWGQQADHDEAIAAGFDAHMTKPVDIRKLSALLDEKLSKAKKR